MPFNPVTFAIGEVSNSMHRRIRTEFLCRRRQGQLILKFNAGCIG